MDKIKSAQSLVDKILDECSCNVVGDDKGALPDIPEDVESSMDDLEDYIMMDESEEVKVSDVPADKQKIFKINRGKAREKGGPLTKAEKGGKPIKESDQVKIAQQLDTLFDNPDRMTKDKTDKETSLDPVPKTEATMAFNVKKYLDTKAITDKSKKGEIPVIQGKRSKRPGDLYASNEGVKTTLNKIASEGWVTDKAQSWMAKKTKAYQKGNKDGGVVAKRQAMMNDIDLIAKK